MIEERDSSESFVVLADESADWKVAGLPQLERLVLALNEFAGASGVAAPLEISIFWRPDISSRTRWLPNDMRMNRVRATESLSSLEGRERVISTRLLVERNGMAEFLLSATSVRLADAGDDLLTSWRDSHERFEFSSREALRAGAEQHWHYLRTVTEIEPYEKVFLRRTGKAQDGIVSRYLNRPLSRPVTRLLLKSEMKPTTWTLAMLALPLVSFPILLGGDYAGILVGASLYQLSSMFDGCDGEIARAKYLESKRGGRLDDGCDMIGGFVFMLGLGFGLSHSHASVLFAGEGILWVLIMAANEFFLRTSKLETNPEASALTGVMYPRHRQLIEHSGILFLGERTISLLVQLSKRDVGILIFFLLALAGLGEWILHLAIVLAAPGLILTAITRLQTRANGRVVAHREL